MTDNTLPQLLSAIQNSDDGDFLRTLAETTLNRLMDFDAENAIGAAHHERSADRTTYRNGYRDRVLETRVGALDLKIPKFRSGQSYYPGFILEPRRLLEKALTAVIQGEAGNKSIRGIDLPPNGSMVFPRAASKSWCRRWA